MKTLSVWDLASKPPEVENILFWGTCPSEYTSNSILHLIDSNPGRYRSEYLSYVHDLAIKKYKGKRVLDLLQIKDGLSYWWMTLIAEKSNFSKSPLIDDAIKMLALKDKLLNSSYSKIILQTEDKILEKSFCILSKELDIEFSCILNKPAQDRFKFKFSIKKILPLPLQALIWLTMHFFKTLPLQGVGLKEWRNSNAKVCFVDYSAYMNSELLEQGKFNSNYWGNLPQKLSEDSIETNWLHLLVKDSNFSSSSDSKKIINSLNRNNLDAVHSCFDSFTSLKIVLKTILDWKILLYKSRNLEEVLSKGCCNNFLWPFLQNDWDESILGKKSLSNLLVLNQLERAMSLLGKQDLGFYLMENVPWEIALNWSWKSKKHIKLLGYPHSAVRFWDLRYYFDTRVISEEVGNCYPRPSNILVIGEASKESLIQGGYPESEMLEVEALRFGFLEDSIKKGPTPVNHSSFKLLVLGDYVYENTILQLSLLDEALRLVKKEVIVALKPHPSCPISPDLFPNLKLNIVEKPIVELYQNYSMAYSSSTTAACLDAYCLGMRLINFSNSNSLNLSPLYGQEGVEFVTNYYQLKLAIEDEKIHTSQPEFGNFFYLNKNLDKWKNLIQIKKKINFLQNI